MSLVVHQHSLNIKLCCELDAVVSFYCFHQGEYITRITKDVDFDIGQPYLPFCKVKKFQTLAPLFMNLALLLIWCYQSVSCPKKPVALIFLSFRLLVKNVQSSRFFWKKFNGIFVLIFRSSGIMKKHLLLLGCSLYHYTHN